MMLGWGTYSGQFTYSITEVFYYITVVLIFVFYLLLVFTFYIFTLGWIKDYPIGYLMLIGHILVIEDYPTGFYQWIWTLTAYDEHFILT